MILIFKLQSQGNTHFKIVIFVKISDLLYFNNIKANLLENYAKFIPLLKDILIRTD